MYTGEIEITVLDENKETIYNNVINYNAKTFTGYSRLHTQLINKMLRKYAEMNIEVILSEI